MATKLDYEQPRTKCSLSDKVETTESLHEFVRHAQVRASEGWTGFIDTPEYRDAISALGHSR